MKLKSLAKGNKDQGKVVYYYVVHFYIHLLPSQYTVCKKKLRDKSSIYTIELWKKERKKIAYFLNTALMYT